MNRRNSTGLMILLAAAHLVACGSDTDDDDAARGGSSATAGQTSSSGGGGATGGRSAEAGGRTTTGGHADAGSTPGGTGGRVPNSGGSVTGGRGAGTGGLVVTGGRPSGTAGSDTGGHVSTLGGSAGMAGSEERGGLGGAAGTADTATGATAGTATGATGGAAAGSAGEGGTAGVGGSVVSAGAGGEYAGAHDIKVDPYGAAPLVAVVNLRGLEPSDVQAVDVIVAGQDGGRDFVKTYAPADTEFAVNLDTSDLDFPEDGFHVPVLGLYADRSNEVRIVVDVLDGDPIDVPVTIETQLTKPDEAAWVPSIQVKTAVTEQMEPGWTVAEISLEPNPNPPILLLEWKRTIAFDERGAIRWALRLDLPQGEHFTLRRSIAGNFLTGSLDTIVEVNELGRIMRQFELPDHTVHHEIIQIGSGDNAEGVASGTKSEHFGNILVLASKNGASTIEDHILELDADTGEVLNDWDLAQVLDPARTTYIDAEKWDISQNGDWLHDNGLAYSTADESIIVSGRHQGVAKIRRDGTLVWLLAPHEGWEDPQAQKLLTAVSGTLEPYADAVQLGTQAAGTASRPSFDWPFGQHSPVLLPNGDLMVFDNGASRHFGGFCNSFSRAVTYRIDEAAMTVRQMAQYVLSKTDSSCYCSNTYQLPLTGNVFIQPAGTNNSIAVAREVTAQVAEDGTLAFDQVVFDATVDMRIIDPNHWYVNSYRGHRWSF